jgi:hypothetical protein
MAASRQSWKLWLRIDISTAQRIALAGLFDDFDFGAGETRFDVNQMSGSS